MDYPFIVDRHTERCDWNLAGPILESALNYVDRGFHPILMHAPVRLTDASIGCTCGRDCGSIGKHSRGKWANRTLTKDSIVSALDIHPVTNLALATGGRSGFFAVDVDGEEGHRSLIALEDRFGPLPNTVKTISGSGKGYHLWYKMPKGVEFRNRASIAGAAKIDIRANGGLIVAPPSLHQTGNLYRFAEGLGLDDIDIAEPEAWVVNFFGAATAVRHAKARKQPSGEPEGGLIIARNLASNSDRNALEGPRKGIERHLSRIGDGDDRDGFDAPIWRTLCAWFARDPERNAEPILRRLREAIVNAPRSAERGQQTKYDTDKYLNDQIAKAKLFASENKVEPKATSEKRDKSYRRWAENRFWLSLERPRRRKAAPHVWTQPSCCFV